MFFPEGQVRVYLYGSPCDMRKSFNALIALTKNAMGKDPLSGHLFVFVNKDEYRTYYNKHRANQALDGLTPEQRAQSSPTAEVINLAC